MEPDDPPPKVYGFKEREFKRDNPTGPGAAPMPTAKELAKLAGAPIPIGRGGATGAKASDPNDVYAALQQNRVVEKQLTGDQVEIRKIKSRRWRDYLVTLIGGNALIIGMVLFLGPNIVSVMFGFGGIIIFSCSLTWIMWQVMGRY